jgi:hypothetical protein
MLETMPVAMLPTRIPLGGFAPAPHRRSTVSVVALQRPSKVSAYSTVVVVKDKRRSSENIRHGQTNGFVNTGMH